MRQLTFVLVFQLTRLPLHRLVPALGCSRTALPCSRAPPPIAPKGAFQGTWADLSLLHKPCTRAVRKLRRPEGDEFNVRMSRCQVSAWCESQQLTRNTPFAAKVYWEGSSARTRNYSNSCNKIAFQRKAIFTAHCHVHSMTVSSSFQMCAARRLSWITFLAVKEGRIISGCQIHPLPCNGKNYIPRDDSSGIEFI